MKWYYVVNETSLFQNMKVNMFNKGGPQNQGTLFLFVNNGNMN